MEQIIEEQLRAVDADNAANNAGKVLIQTLQLLNSFDFCFSSKCVLDSLVVTMF